MLESGIMMNVFAVNGFEKSAVVIVLSQLLSAESPPCLDLNN